MPAARSLSHSLVISGLGLVWPGTTPGLPYGVCPAGGEVGEARENPPFGGLPRGRFCRFELPRGESLES
jgi:hypothetical protein